MTKLAVKIEIREYEKGWGNKIDDYMVCISNEDALKFKEEFNSQNTADSAPDWYLQCEWTPIPIDLTEKQYNKLEESGREWLSVLNAL